MEDGFTLSSRLGTIRSAYDDLRIEITQAGRSYSLHNMATGKFFSNSPTEIVRS